LSGPDISRFTRDPDLYRTVGRVFLTLGGSHEAETEETFADAGAMIDTLAFVAALIVEAAPNVKTPRDMRHGADAVAKDILEYTRAIRAMNDDREQPLITEFGGLRAIEMDDASPIGS
jgi:hypothetical protein